MINATNWPLWILVVFILLLLIGITYLYCWQPDKLTEAVSRIKQIRLKSGKGRKMLLTLGIIIIIVCIGGIIGAGFLIRSQLETPQEKMAQFIEQTNKMEGNILEKDLDVDIDYAEGIPANGIMIIVVHGTISNESSNPKSIQANMSWRVQLNGDHEMRIAPWEPPTNIVSGFKDMIEKGNGRSFGDYLKSPLNLDPQKSVSGFMLFSMPLQACVDFNQQLLPFITSTTVGTKLPDSKLYLEWTDKMTKGDFRKLIVSMYSQSPEKGFQCILIGKPTMLQGNQSVVIPLR
jgi:hypothetical protein